MVVKAAPDLGVAVIGVSLALRSDFSCVVEPGCGGCVGMVGCGALCVEGVRE